MQTIKDFENYLITKDGDIYRNITYRKLKCSSDKNGYLKIRLLNKSGRKSMFLHRLLAIQFIPNPLNKPFINHIDGNKSNNKLNNLEWCTHKENMKHAWDNNLYKDYTESIKKANNATSIEVFDTLNNIKYKSMSEMSRLLKIPFTTLRRLIDSTTTFKISLKK
jgi:hypothetical protein